MTRNWKTGFTLAFTGKNYFCILGLGLDLDLGLGSVALAYCPWPWPCMSLAFLISLNLVQHYAERAHTSRLASTSTVSCSIFTISFSVFADVFISSGWRFCSSCCITDTYNTATTATFLMRTLPVLSQFQVQVPGLFWKRTLRCLSTGKISLMSSNQQYHEQEIMTAQMYPRLNLVYI